MAVTLALLALEPLAAGGTYAAAPDDSGTFLADASSTSLPSYSYHVLNTARADDIARVELAGLSIDGKDIGTGIAVVRRGDITLAPVQALLGALALPARGDADSISVETPLGTATLDLRSCERIDGASFCAIDALAASLALELVFEPSEFALRARTAWPSFADPSASASIPIDVPAPAYSLSYARTQVGYRREAGRDDVSGTGEFGGGLGNGFWRSAWFQDSGGRRGLYDYAWITQLERSRFLIGHQVMGLDPLLPSFDLLGVQGAWTNRPEAVFGGSTDTRRLVTDRFLPDRSLRGEGPPGGRAELRVNGEIIDSLTIPLSGQYSFDRVQRSVDPLAVVQVHLYERAFDTVPLRVEDRSFQSSERLLERGATLQFAGIGVQDNPLGDSRLRDSIDGETAGFWQGRVGVGERVTLEAAAQRSQEGTFAIAGAHVGLGYGVLSALAGRNEDGAQALRVQTDGQRRQWFWRGFVQEEDADYRNRAINTDPRNDRSLRYAETGWVGHRWVLSLVGRQEDTGFGGQRIDFIKPALSAQPLDSVSISIRPGSEGEYGYLARWAPHPRLYFNAFRDRQRDQFEAHSEISARTRLVAGWVRDEFAGDRRSLVGYREGAGARQWRYGAGVLESEGEFGWLFETGAEFGSGLYLSAQALDDPLNRRSGNGGTTLWLNLTIDLVNSGNGFVRSSYHADYSQNGSISGRVVPPSSNADDALDGIPVRVDGFVRAYTDERGGFHVPGLAPGVHRIELDDEKVPLDMAAAQRRLGVEVAPGRSTPVRFGLELRLGLAGRVLDAAGRAVTAATVRLRDADGTDRGIQDTDAYGYFRFSELPPGRYRLSLASADVAAPAEREVELVDRYVFDQDLELSK